MKLKTKAPLSYYGSDAGVAPQLGAMFDKYSHVTIPFCGGLSILPYLKARAIVANDLNDLAINFYEVMSTNDRDLLIAKCKRTLSHPKHLNDARSTMASDRIQRAWAYWCICWLTRKGQGGSEWDTNSTPSVSFRPNGGMNATRIKSAAADLELWAKHFERCDFSCWDFRKVLEKAHDNPKCGIYCDPPFAGPGDHYIHKMSDKDHIELKELLSRFRETLVVVRYGDRPKIRELYEGWRVIEARSRTQANKSIVELWITNKDQI